MSPEEQQSRPEANRAADLLNTDKAKSAMDIWEEQHPPVTPHEWDDPGSSEPVEAALFWAAAGLEVRPSGWTVDAWVTRPEDVAVAFSGQHAADGIVTRAPSGTVAVLTEGPIDQPLPLFGQGPELVWDEGPPHALAPNWAGDCVQETFTVWLGLDAAVRVWLAPLGLELPVHHLAHHLPRSSVLTTRHARTPFPLPPAVRATGTLQPLPAHLARLLDPAPLPCREQAKGTPCASCAGFGNEWRVAA